LLILNNNTHALIPDPTIHIKSAIESSLLEDRRKQRQKALNTFVDDSDAPPKNSQSSRQSNRRKHGRGRRQNFDVYEDEQKKHLEWMVHNTANILGPENMENVGDMSPQMIETAFQVMQAWAQRAGTVQSSKAPHVIEALLKRLLQERNAVKESRKKDQDQASEDGNITDDDVPDEVHGVKIDTDVYDTVLAGWANSREKGSAERAEEILLQMEQSKGLQPTTRSYNMVLKAYVKNGDRGIAANKANDLVEKMEASDDETIVPNIRTYNLLLYALANAPNDTFENAAETSLAVLERMLERYRTEGDDCSARPNTNCFNQVITAWARGTSPNFERNMEDVYDLFNKLCEELQIFPDRDTYTAMMGGWLKSKDPNAFAKIRTIFADMEKSFEGGNYAAKPNRVTLNTVQVALKNFLPSNVDVTRKIGLLERKYKLPITHESQNILMDSIIKSGVDDAPEQAMEMLTRMEEDFRNGYEEMKPDQCSYSSVIQAYSRYNRHDRGEVADDLLERMWDLHRNYGGDVPDVDMYNNVVNAFASLQSWGAIGRVKQVLHEMESGTNNEIPRPNLKTYNIVMKTMRSRNEEDGAVFAEHILLTLESIGERDASLLPDAYSYSSVITAYARSKSPIKAEKSLELVNRMRSACDKGNYSACITILSLNAALNACAFVDGSPEERAKAFEIAMKLDEIRKTLHIKGDNTWYGTMLRASSFLLKPSWEREDLVDQVFQEACDEGCVGKLVLTQLKFAATANQYERLLDFSPEDRISLSDLPKEWTCNGSETRPRSVGKR
ncbi:MAG: hypothetical protein SGILL_005723, partial [Bacillariaceae sp.]